MILDIPLGFVSRVDKVGGARTPGDNYGLEIVCKDVRNLRFALHKVEGHPRKDIYESLTSNSFPLSHEKILFCYGYKEQYPSNGWSVYDAGHELRRLGVGGANSDWVISRLINTTININLIINDIQVQ